MNWHKVKDFVYGWLAVPAGVALLGWVGVSTGWLGWNWNGWGGSRADIASVLLFFGVLPGMMYLAILRKRWRKLTAALEDMTTRYNDMYRALYAANTTIDRLNTQLSRHENPPEQAWATPQG